MAYYKKNYNSDGQSAEDKALDRFAEMMIEKINTLQGDWKKPWFTESALKWPKNLSGREYNASFITDVSFKINVHLIGVQAVGISCLLR